MQQRFKKELPPTIPVVPNSFPSLEALGLSDLQRLQADDGEYRAFLDKCTFAQQLEKLKEAFDAVSERVQQECDAAIAKLDEGDGMAEFLTLKKEYDEMEAVLKAKKEKLDAISASLQGAGLARRLQDMADEANSRCSTMAEQLTDGELELKKFAKEYVPHRQLVHEREMKAKQATQGRLGLTRELMIDADLTLFGSDDMREIRLVSQLADSTHVAAREALISAFRLSVAITASIPGDVPTLLKEAFSRHFDEQMPAIHDAETTNTPTSAASLDSLTAMLSEIPPLEPAAQVLLDRARSIITSGPPLSMNVELAAGQELPAALHTLNQGAVWACLLGGGANPDLEDRLLEEYPEDWADATEMRDKIYKALTPEAKCLWFLCRKFFFTWNVAEKDGESCQWNAFGRCYHHRMYMGRLFMLDSHYQSTLSRAGMPRALEVYSDGATHIARTPKGLWGWGHNDVAQLGFKTSGFVDPTRLTFPPAPRMVTDVSMKGYRTFILTPVGTVMAGFNAQRYVGPVDRAIRNHFHPVAVPTGFVPDHIMQGSRVAILSMGDRQMIGGSNWDGRLGLGHENWVTGFVDLPFRVDRIVSDSFNVFLSGRQLLFAGEVLKHIAQSGLLPGFSHDDNCLTPTPLRFPERVKGFFASNFDLIWVTEGKSHYCKCDAEPIIIPFEATSFCKGSFCNLAGQWFEASHGSGEVAEMEECKAPPRSEQIILVDPETPSE
nr:vacuolar protein sorting 37 [Carpediemonas membranifera]